MLCWKLMRRVMLLLAVATLASGCATRSPSPAPVEDRTGSASQPAGSPAGAATPGVIVSTLPAATGSVFLGKFAAFAGQPGYHTVKPGENLLRIGMEHGQRSRDIATWNDITNPNLIEVNQVLRVHPPGSTPPGAATASTRPSSVTVASLPPTGTGTAATPMRTASAPVQGASAPPADTDISFIWPAKGNIIATFDGERSLGIDIAGKPGDPIIAAADGQVIYAGAGLRGYGNFIIVKHNNTFLTAYANNQSLLVKEDQIVRKGQKIAEMGQSDSDRVKLHFEIRRLGKSVDPMKMLPPKPAN